MGIRAQSVKTLKIRVFPSKEARPDARPPLRHCLPLEASEADISRLGLGTDEVAAIMILEQDAETAADLLQHRLLPGARSTGRFNTDDVEETFRIPPKAKSPISHVPYRSRFTKRHLRCPEG